MLIVGISKSTKVSGTFVVLKIVNDDSSIVDEDNGLKVNSTDNNLLVCFYMRGDCYANMFAHGRHFPASMQALIDDGLVVDGRKYDMEVTLGGDMKLLNGWMGLCGCNSMYPACVYCKCHESELHWTKECGDQMVALQCGT
jgi:hypothetical protein